MKMNIDIWSDIMCPFCYIGKRRLEKALEAFPQRDDVSINWHSFQLDPSIQYQPGVNLHQYLADRKGQTLEWSVKMHEQMTQSAKADGLTYNFDKAVIANSFDAHRLIQLAKKYKLGDAAEERLFRAYFTEGENMGDHATLSRIGTEIGLPQAAISDMLEGDDFAGEVHADIAQAEAYGIRGVPFFVINDKYGISGAQPSEVFLDGLQTAWKEYEQAKNAAMISVADGAVCTPDGNCN
jgi:predicted DsbA family dithiol-disulfide isomerase